VQSISIFIYIKSKIFSFVVSEIIYNLTLPICFPKKFLASTTELFSSASLLCLTVPSQLVDLILHILRFFRIIDAMSPEQHYGFKPKEVLPLFHRAGFKLLIHKKFELGLNHLFVFEKSINAKSSSGKYF